MANLSGFDANKVDPEAPRELIPEGWYRMIIVASEVKDAASGNGNRYLQLEMSFDESYHPKLARRKVWDRLNLWNSNTTASEIAQRQLSSLCRAVGVMTPQDSSDLHHKPISVLVKIRPERDGYAAQNEVGGYEGPGKAGASANGSGTPASAPQAAPQAQQGAPSPQPTNGGDKPSWAV